MATPTTRAPAPPRKKDFAFPCCPNTGTTSIIPPVIIPRVPQKIAMAAVQLRSEKTQFLAFASTSPVPVRKLGFCIANEFVIQKKVLTQKNRYITTKSFLFFLINFIIVSDSPVAQALPTPLPINFSLSRTCQLRHSWQ